MKALTSRFCLSTVLTSLCAGGMMALGVTIGASPAFAQTAAAPTDLAQLRDQFAAPPAEARPWTWFHVMSGNMTRAGVTKDLESLADVGIGGIILFHVTQGISHGPVKFNSPQHLDLIAHVAAECERLGLKFSFHNADGWSSSGGPWITPEHSMKRVVWSQALVQGGGAIDLRLPQPATRAGLYEDIATLAYPALAGELADLANPARLTSSDEALNLSRLADGNDDTTAAITIAEGDKGWVQFSYSKPVAIAHVRVGNIRLRRVAVDLQVSDDGINFRKVADMPLTRLLRDQWDLEAGFAPVSGQYFRVGFAAGSEFGEIALSQAGLVDNAPARLSLGHVFGKDLAPVTAATFGDVIDPERVVDLSAMMSADGRLRGNLPDGAWTIMRFGYTSTAARNVNPSPEGEGLEVDKFDPAAFRAHHEAFIKPVIDLARQSAPNAMNGVMIDSYEVGGQNWTGGYDQIFREEYGYDLTRWLPAYAGRIVQSAAATDEFHGRIRDLNAALIQRNYYSEFAELMAEEGLESFIQPYGSGPFDEVAVGSIASVPAGEFWVRRMDLTRLNGTVSAARIYGKPLAAAEAFTATQDDNWNFTPAFGKRFGDFAWVNGVNQFFFHRFAHQANTHVMPGMTMNRWGSHFDRTQPWWDRGGKGWFTYMARGQHMLRQGRAVADVALLVGSQSPVECPEKRNMQGMLPAGVEFDCVDTPSLLERGQFENGEFVMPGGARYQMIWWPHSFAPSGPEMAQIEAARAAGVPVAMANRGDDAAMVFSDAGLLPRVSAAGAMPGFTHRKAGGTDIFFALNDAEEPRDFDLCFRVGGKAGEVWNPVTGASKAVAGSVDSEGCSNIAMTLAPFESRFVVFDEGLEFSNAQQTAPGDSKVLATLDDAWSLTFDPVYSDAGTLGDVALFDWSTSDDPEIRHFSGKATYRNVITLSPGDLAGGKRMQLDLGTVANVASVRVNGVDMGTVWTGPYAIDITDALQAGGNAIEIEVANLWVNRLIGDAALPDASGFVPEDTLGYGPHDARPQRDMVEWYSANQPPPPGPRRTFATAYFQKADDPLVPAGLIGPVTITVQGN